MSDALECRVCYLRYDPANNIIPLQMKGCTHNFCSLCLTDVLKRPFPSFSDGKPNTTDFSCPFCKVVSVVDRRKSVFENFRRNIDLIGAVETFEEQEREKARIQEQAERELNAQRALAQEAIAERNLMKQRVEKEARTEEEKERAALPNCHQHQREKMEFVCLDDKCKNGNTTFCSECSDQNHKSCQKRVKVLDFEKKVKLNGNDIKRLETLIAQQEQLIIDNCKALQKRLLGIVGSYKQKLREAVDSLGKLSLEDYLRRRSEFRLSKSEERDGGISLQILQVESVGEVLRDLERGLSNEVFWEELKGLERATLALHTRRSFELLPATSADSQTIVKRLETTNKYLLQHYFLSDWDKLETVEKEGSLANWQSKVANCFNVERLKKTPLTVIQKCSLEDTTHVEDTLRGLLPSATSMGLFCKSVESQMNAFYQQKDFEWTCVCEPNKLYPSEKVMAYVQVLIGKLRVALWAKRQPECIRY